MLLRMPLRVPVVGKGGEMDEALVEVVMPPMLVLLLISSCCCRFASASEKEDLRRIILSAFILTWMLVRQ